MRIDKETFTYHLFDGVIKKHIVTIAFGRALTRRERRFLNKGIVIVRSREDFEKCQ